MTDLMNDEAVYRTAPATPGLLNIKRTATSDILFCSFLFITTHLSTTSLREIISAAY